MEGRAWWFEQLVLSRNFFRSRNTDEWNLKLQPSLSEHIVRKLIRKTPQFQVFCKFIVSWNKFFLFFFFGKKHFFLTKSHYPLQKKKLTRQRNIIGTQTLLCSRRKMQRKKITHLLSSLHKKICWQCTLVQNCTGSMTTLGSNDEI